jgi:glycosyltransferase involved in cell wall biosynthesis
MTPPKVSVLLPVYNAAPYLAATLHSIRVQTLTDFEIIAINDGSTDNSAEILHATMKEDSRLRVIEHENRGLVSVLNEAIEVARAPYLARLDADDLALPARFAAQAAWLDDHPDIAVLGSFIETFTDDSPSDFTLVKYPTEPAAIAATLIFRNPLAHPSVMLRRSHLDAHRLRYEEPFRCAQDNYLWVRCTEHRLAIANVPQALTRYRFHRQQLTHQHAGATRAEGVAIRLHLLKLLRPPRDSREHALHEALALDELVPTPSFIRDAAQWLNTLAAANDERRFFDREAFLQVLTGRFVALSRFARSQGLPIPDSADTPFAALIREGSL